MMSLKELCRKLKGNFGETHSYYFLDQSLCSPSELLLSFTIHSRQSFLQSLWNNLSFHKLDENGARVQDLFNRLLSLKEIQPPIEPAQSYKLCCQEIRELPSSLSMSILDLGQTNFSLF